MIMASKRQDLSGQRFGRLIVEAGRLAHEAVGRSQGEGQAPRDRALFCGSHNRFPAEHISMIATPRHHDADLSQE